MIRRSADEFKDYLEYFSSTENYNSMENPEPTEGSPRATNDEFAGTQSDNPTPQSSKPPKKLSAKFKSLAVGTVATVSTVVVVAVAPLAPSVATTSFDVQTNSMTYELQVDNFDNQDMVFKVYNDYLKREVPITASAVVGEVKNLTPGTNYIVEVKLNGGFGGQVLFSKKIKTKGDRSYLGYFPESYYTDHNLPPPTQNPTPSERPTPSESPRPSPTTPPPSPLPTATAFPWIDDPIILPPTTKFPECGESKLEQRADHYLVWKFNIAGDTDDFAYKVVFAPDAGDQTILADSSYTQAISEFVVPTRALSRGTLKLVAYDKKGKEKVIAAERVSIPEPPTP